MWFRAAILWASLLGVAVGLPAEQSAAELVRELGEFPPVLAFVPSTGVWGPEELRRQDVYRLLRTMGTRALPALKDGLADQDVRVRRGTALYLSMAGSSWGGLAPVSLDIREALPALIRSTQDVDGRVRWTAAQAIADIGPEAAKAVPDLLKMLESLEEGDRISGCIGLRGIGPLATAALPALREALDDPEEDVRRFAAHAIEKIEGQPDAPR